MKHVFLAALLHLASLAFVRAETSSEYAKLGLKAWSAFECAIAAELMGDRETQARHFRLGYNSGKTFLEAFSANKVDEMDIRNTVPYGFTSSMEGPSVDFVLGRFWEIVANHFYKGFYDNCSLCIRDDELKEMEATTQFRKMNCDLLE